jgi:uncharacterized membrane protein (UPF0127 family)
VKVVNQTRGTLIGDRVVVADSPLSRLFGLIPKRGLDAGEGLWIRPSSGVHTFGMRFTIDVIGLDKDRRVVKLWENLVPFRVTSVSTKLKSVVELPAGTIQASAVQVGDLLQMS